MRLLDVREKVYKRYCDPTFVGEAIFLVLDYFARFLTRNDGYKKGCPSLIYIGADSLNK